MDIVGSADSIIQKRSVEGVTFDSHLITSDSSDHDERNALSRSSSANKSRVIDLFDPVDAISSNREQTMVVGAGSRGVLKIFKVTDDGIERVSDLRAMKSRRLTLMYSPSNVAWSKVKDELIATTSTNGAVVLWHAEKGRMDIHYKAHTRSATVVHFHRSDEHLLISGSKDSTIILYDTRMPDPVKTFRGAKSDVTVRDLSFCLHQGQHNSFISADEGGYVKVWDMRSDGPVSIFQPHQGYVSSIALSPSDPKLVASGGGRDKNIKVWNWCDSQHSEPFPLYQVETIAPVGRVYWRPDHPWQVASCAVVNDMSVLVWDIRRPYLPVISFFGHKDSVTDVWWSASHPHRFVSSGKDGLLILHEYAEGDPTLDHLCDTPIDLAPDGLLAVAVNSQIHLKNQDKWDANRSTLQLSGAPNRVQRSSAQQKAFSQARRQQSYDAFRGPVQSRMSCGVLDRARNSLQPIAFARLAEGYRVGGASLVELCQQNSRVAASLGQEGAERAETWRHVAVLLAHTDFQKVYDQEAVAEIEDEKRRWKVYVTEQENQGEWAYLRPQPQPATPVVLMQPRIYTTWRNPAAARWKRMPRPGSCARFSIHPEVSSGQPSGDFYFGPGELRGAAMMDSEEPECVEFTGLPREAFELKPLADSRRYRELANMNGTEDDWLPVDDSKNWDPLKVLTRTLCSIAEQGDVQLCASAATVCGHLLSKEVSNYKTESWIHSYLGMLERLEMFQEAASLLKWTWIRRLAQKTSESTYQKEELFHLRPVPHLSPCWEGEGRLPPGCLSIDGRVWQTCNANVKRGRCERCGDEVMPCCVLCDEVIKGQVWSCIKCNHTMHPEHALTWWDTDPGNSVDCDLEEEWHVDDPSPPLRTCPLPWCQCVCSIPFAEEDDVNLVEAMESVRIRKDGQQLLCSSAGRLVYNWEADFSREAEGDYRLIRYPAGRLLEVEFEEDKQNPAALNNHLPRVLPLLRGKAVNSAQMAFIHDLLLAIGCVGPDVFRKELEKARQERERIEESQLQSEALDLCRHLKAVHPGRDPLEELLREPTAMRAGSDEMKLWLRKLPFVRKVQPLGRHREGPLPRRESRLRDIVLSVFRPTRSGTDARNRERAASWQQKVMDRRSRQRKEREELNKTAKKKSSRGETRKTTAPPKRRGEKAEEDDDLVVLNPLTGQPMKSIKKKRTRSIFDVLKRGKEEEERRKRRDAERQRQLEEEQREREWWSWGARPTMLASRAIVNDAIEDILGEEVEEQKPPPSTPPLNLQPGVRVSVRPQFRVIRESSAQFTARQEAGRQLAIPEETNKLAITLNGPYEEIEGEEAGDNEDWRTTMLRMAVARRKARQRERKRAAIKKNGSNENRNVPKFTIGPSGYSSSPLVATVSRSGGSNDVIENDVIANKKTEKERGRSSAEENSGSNPGSSQSGVESPTETPENQANPEKGSLSGRKPSPETDPEEEAVPSRKSTLTSDGLPSVYY